MLQIDKGNYSTLYCELQHWRYDEKGRIKTRDEIFLIHQTSFLCYYMHFLPDDRQEDWTNSLTYSHRAGVSPDDIININVRELLINKQSRHPQKSQGLVQKQAPPVHPPAFVMPPLSRPFPATNDTHGPS